MAIRVLATIPELPVTASPVAPEPTASEEQAPVPRPAPLPAPRRAHAKASFPGVSVVVLALVAAALWSLAASREATRRGSQGTARIAAEPLDAGATETIRR